MLTADGKAKQISLSNCSKVTYMGEEGHQDFSI